MKSKKSISLFFVFVLAFIFLAIFSAVFMRKEEVPNMRNNMLDFTGNISDYAGQDKPADQRKEDIIEPSAEMGVPVLSGITANSFAEKIKEADESPEERYVLIICDDRLTVFLEDCSTVYMETDIFVSRLPEDIQNRLQQGIAFDSEKDLYDFLENYSS